MQPLTHSTPFLTSITVKPDCVDEYMKLAKETDSAVEATEPGKVAPSHANLVRDLSHGSILLFADLQECYTIRGITT